MEDPEFIDGYTQKGKTAVTLEGYAYIKDKDLVEDKVRYKCIHYRTCKGFIWILDRKALTFPNGSRLGRQHNHEVEPERIAAKQRVKVFKEAAKDQPHAQIGALAMHARDCETVVADVMPSSELLKRIGRRVKRKQFGPAQRIEQLGDVEMTLDRSRIAIRGPAGDLCVNFMLHDAGPNDPQRMMMFATTTSLAALSRSQKIHADGTFSITPQPFKQLYVLHFEEGDKLFPAVFVLLPGKSKALYDRMLQILQTFARFEATTVVTDYEFQAIQSFQDIMRVDVAGCYFHYAQAVMKRAGRPLFKRMARLPLMKQHYVMLRALAYLPPADIPAAFDALVNLITRHGHHDDFAELLVYMETTWVAPDCHPNRPALGKFPPTLWSVHTRSLTEQDRTNNKVEGWHHKINSFMEYCHPTFYVFLDELKKFFRHEEDRRREHLRAETERAARRANGEIFPPTRDPYAIRSAQLRIICEKYQNQDNLYVTMPQSTGLIRFLSDIAALLTR